MLAALAGAVKTFGGHVDKLTGDGIMAVFGAPVAHEDDPERAVRAALAMQRAVRRVLDDERGGGAPVGLRIGVNTGEVVAGVQASLEYTVIGDTVNTAARLADAAAVGAVYAGAATERRPPGTSPSWRRLLPLRLKGKRQAVEAYELLGPLDAPGTRSGLGDEGPFVGREPETGAGGAAGSPRSSTAASPRCSSSPPRPGSARPGSRPRPGRVRRRLRPGRRCRRGARVLSVRCAAYGERWRLGPLADLVRAAIGLPDQPSVAATRAVAEERLRRRRSDRASAAPESRPGCTTEQLLALLGYADPPVDRDRAPGPATARIGRRAVEATGERHPDRRGRAALRAGRPRRRWSSSWTTCTTPARATVDALGRHPEPARRPGAGGAARPAGAGPLGRRVDPARRRRGARRCRRCAAPRRPGCSPPTSAAAGCPARTPTGCSPPPRATRSTWPSWSRC